MISEWTYKKNYQQGLMILAQSNISPTILGWLQKAENPATRAMMEKQIKALADAQTPTKLPPPPIQKPLEMPKKPLPSEHKATKSQLEDAPDAPQAVKDLVAKRKELYNQKRKLKAELNQMVWFESRFSNTERGLKKNEHQATIQQLKEIWKDINYYRQHHKLPDVIAIAPKPEIDANKIRLRINTLRTYISKAKKSDKKPKRLEEYIAELHQLEAQVNEQNSKTKQ